MDILMYERATMAVRTVAVAEARFTSRNVGAAQLLVALILGDERIACVLDEMASMSLRAVREAIRTSDERVGRRECVQEPDYTEGFRDVFESAELVDHEPGARYYVSPVDVLAALFESQDPMMLYLLDEVFELDRADALAQVREAATQSLVATR